MILLLTISSVKTMGLGFSKWYIKIKKNSGFGRFAWAEVE
jgi:hypothetical protein